ncbi:hypothetical protein FSEG_02227, partial [Fusobacterium necrophorum D12]
MKIKKPFRYMGSKGRFYNEIKGIFEENKKEKYVDLFAGGMEVAVNLKEDFPDVQILANIKDEHVESFVKHRKAVLGQYLKVIDFIYQGTEKEDARKTYYKKKEWGQLKARYREFGDGKYKTEKNEKHLHDIAGYSFQYHRISGFCIFLI